MKNFCFALFIAFLTCSIGGFCQDERVLVVIPDPFIRNALVQRLQIEGYHNIREEACNTCDFTSLFANFRPDYVIVDGSKNNAADTMIIDTQVINTAHKANVKKTLVLSPADIYSLKTPLPFKEDTLLNVKLDTLSDPQAIAKITALKQCHEYNGLKRPRFIFCPYPRLCGPHDTGFTVHSHDPVKNVAARILRAKWQQEDFAVISNDGKARYEFMHIDDMCSAVVFMLTAPTEDEIVNIGYGRDTTIKVIAGYIKEHLKFLGNLIFDCTSYDEVPRQVLDNSRLTMLGWYSTVTAQDVIKDTVLWLETTLQKPYKASEDTPFILP